MGRVIHSHPRPCPYSREPPWLRQLKIPSRMLKKPASRGGWPGRLPCARATRGIKRPSLDARSGGLIRAILGNVHEQAWKDHLYSLAAALPAEQRVLARWGWAGQNRGLFEHPA